MADSRRVGTSGWVYPHWKGRFYPKDLPQRDWFGYYARHFDTVEINNTFYRLPTEDAVVRWREHAPDGFVYAVKASRFLTHVKRLNNVEVALERFMDVVTLLRDHLGPILCQFPETFHRTDVNERRLRTFFGMLPPKPPFVMEFRHESWFTDDVYSLMADYDVGLCIVSDPKRPTHVQVTSNVVYVRFHGPRQKRYRGSYPEVQLREWADRIADLARGKDAYIYFNNDWKGHAIRNAMRLRELLGLPEPTAQSDS